MKCWVGGDLIGSDRKQTGGEVGINWLTGKSHRRNFRTDENVLYLDYGNGYMGISICQNSSNCTLKTGIFIICKPYIIKLNLKG